MSENPPIFTNMALNCGFTDRYETYFSENYTKWLFRNPTILPYSAPNARE